MSCGSAAAPLLCAEASWASSVTEWVRERRAEKCRVTVKVNKIKAGNLRASVPHKRCRQQRKRGGGEGKRQGWMRGLQSVCEHACLRMCVCVDLLVGSSPTLQATHCDSMMRVLYSECVFTSHTVGPVALCKPAPSSWTRDKRVHY